jgi:hypothetical protein
MVNYLVNNSGIFSAPPSSSREADNPTIRREASQRIRLEQINYEASHLVSIQAKTVEWECK